jgi:hypothetical protein
LGKKGVLNIKSHIEKVKSLVPGQMSAVEQAFVLSTLEAVLYILEEQSELIQELKDEVNRLKGEQGKPNISGKNQKESNAASGNVSSEKERKKNKGGRNRRQVKFDSNCRIDEKEVIDIDEKSDLPWDIEFKGYAKSHYQSLEIKGKLIEVQRAIYYSASTGKTYTAALPGNYEMGHDYTQELKAHIIMFKFEFGMSIPKIGDFLRMSGIAITNGTICNILLASGEDLKEDRTAIHRNGLEAGLYAQTDTTGARLNGVNCNAHVFGNSYYTAYFTTPHKDRQTVLDLLRGGQPRTYVLNEATLRIYDYLQVPEKIKKCLRPIGLEQPLDYQAFINRIKPVLEPKDYERQEEKLLEGAYLAAYQQDHPLHILVCDDAPQYKLLALLIALCWVHAGRHFKKLNPKLTHHQQLLDAFLNEFWQFYHRLKAYKQAPDPLTAKQLSADFDQIFSRKTGYEQLDQRIAKTKAKKMELLVVLKHPYVPLHNNASELAARKEVRYRDISFQTRTPKGTQAKDVFFTIIQTCKKLGVNAYAYMLDRVTKKRQMIPLQDLIFQKAFAF